MDSQDFKDKANNLIYAAEKNKIIPHEYRTSITQKNTLSCPHTVAENDISNFINTVSHKRYYLDKKSDSINNYLTSMELACIKWGVKGKTAEETGKILGISKRTCEAHLHNVKTKLGYYKQLPLGYIISRIFPDYLINS